MRSALCLIAAFAALLTATPIHSIDYNELAAGAIERDPTVAILQHRYESVVIAVGQARRETPFRLSAGLFNRAPGVPGVTGTVYVSPGPGQPLVEATVTPAAQIVFPGPIQSALYIGAPISVSIVDGVTNVTISPGVSVEQSLHPLFYDDIDPATAMYQEHQLLAARIAIWQRTLAVRRLVANATKEAAQLIQSHIVLRREIESRERNLARLRVVETNVERSPEYQKLVLSQETANLQIVVANERIEFQRIYLADLTGVRPVELAGQPFVELPQIELFVPDVDETLLSRNPGILDSQVGLDLAILALSSARETPRPEWTADASYGFVADSVTGLGAHELGAGLVGDFENFSFRAGLSASIDEPSIGFSIGMAFSLPDAAAEESELALLEHDLEISRIAAERARRSFGQMTADLQLQFREMEIREHQLHRLSDILAREREVIARAVEAGLADDDELQRLEWALDDLAFDNYYVLIDRVFLALDLEALFIPLDLVR